MKYYDFKKAYEIIQSELENGLVEADLGMQEDWRWTAETMYPVDFDVRTLKKIGGISGSNWATPSCRR